MPRETLTLKLLRVVENSYRPPEEEVLRLTELSKLNKLYLAFLRNVNSEMLYRELLLEESKYRWYLRNAMEVAKALTELRYAFYKFRRPVGHVSVDLDVLVHVDDIPEAVRRLKSRGFSVIVVEPYTVTLERRGFIVDLYTQPSFAWVVYMDGVRILEECSEDIEINGFPARGVTREAEVVIAAGHAVYKEHIVLLVDCLTMWKWASRKTIGLAKELKTLESIRILMWICDLIEKATLETPTRLPTHLLLKAYLEKFTNDKTFVVTTPNIIKYLVKRRDVGSILFKRITRRSY